MNQKQLLLMLKLGVKLKRPKWTKSYIHMVNGELLLNVRGVNHGVDIDDYFHPHSDDNWVPIDESQTS